MLTDVANVGPRSHPECAYLASARSMLDLEGFAGHDDVVVSRFVQDPWPRTIRMTVPRCGGRWLSLVCSGYKLRLNTGPEAEAVLQAVQDEPDAA